MRRGFRVLGGALRGMTAMLGALAWLLGVQSSSAADPPSGTGLLPAGDRPEPGPAPSPVSQPASAPYRARRLRLPGAVVLVAWARRRRRLATVLAVVAVFGLGVGVWAFFTAGATAGSAGMAQAGTVGVPTGVTVPAYSTTGTVHVTWTGTTLSNADAVQGYHVQRYLGSTPSDACGTTLASPTASLSCDDTGVADGQYTYTVSAVFHNWFKESTTSAAVNADATQPSSTITFPASGPYIAASWNAGCSSSICGTANDPGASASGVSQVQVSVFSAASGKYWNASSSKFNSTPEMKLTASGTTSWAFAFPASNFLQSGGGDGTYTVRTYASDVAGNTQASATTQIFTYDATAPTVTVNQKVGQADPTKNLPIHFTALFSEPVNALPSNGTGVVLGGTANHSSATISVSQTNSSTYDISVSGLTGDGTLTATLSAAATTDLAGNNSVASTSTDNSVTYDTIVPTISREVVADATANTAGFIRQNTTYYAYAQVSDTGSGVGSVTADVHTTTTGATAVAMSTAGGPWTIGGQSYNYRSTIQTANSPLSEAGNAYSFGIAASDSAANSTSASSTVNVDNTAPTGGSVDATGLVGTDGRYSTSTTLNIAFSPGSDGAGSGLAASGFQLLRASATLTSAGIADGACTVYNAYIQVGANDPTSPVTGSTGITSGNCYSYRYVVKDKLGNTTTYTSGDIKVDTLAPSAPAITLSGATGKTFIIGTTVFINAQAGNSGSFTATATSTDAQSGILKLNFPSLSGFSGGGDDTSSPYSSGIYSWSGAVGASGSQTVTATNNGTLTSTASFAVTPDTAIPTLGAVTVNGTAATAGGSTSSINNSTSFTLGPRTNYSDAVSGLASSVLTVQSESLSGSTCGAPGSGGPFTSATVIATTTQPAGIVAGFCYLYTLTGTDNVGNTTSVSTTVVDNSVSFTVTTQPTTVTAGVATASNAVVITAVKNGATDTAYSGTLTWSGANNSPSGATPALPTSPTWTSGVATFGITLVKAESETLSATDGTRTANFAAITVNAAAAARLAWTNVTISGGALSSPCLFTCTATGVGSNGTFTANVAVTDSLGNTVSALGSGHTVSVTTPTSGAGSGGIFTSPTSGPVSLTISIAGPAVSTQPFIFKGGGTGNWTDTLSTQTTLGTSYTLASATVSKQ